MQIVRLRFGSPQCGPSLDVAAGARSTKRTPRDASVVFRRCEHACLGDHTSPVEDRGVRDLFRPETLEKFEDASTSIPLLALDRAFAAAKIVPGKDPGGKDGARRAQFRRYIASIEQRDPEQIRRLGAALGALIAQVALSKRAYLVTAAESDGFVLIDGAFVPAARDPRTFAIARADELASVDERLRRLQRLADTAPLEAFSAARTLIESVCRIVLSQIGEAQAPPADLAEIIAAALRALDGPVDDRDDAEPRRRLGAIVAQLLASRDAAPRHVRLVLGVAGALAADIAQTFGAEREADRTAGAARLRRSPTRSTRRP